MSKRKNAGDRLELSIELITKAAAASKQFLGRRDLRAPIVVQTPKVHTELVEEVRTHENVLGNVQRAGLEGLCDGLDVDVVTEETENSGCHPVGVVLGAEKCPDHDDIHIQDVWIAAEQEQVDELATERMHDLGLPGATPAAETSGGSDADGAVGWEAGKQTVNDSGDLGIGNGEPPRKVATFIAAQLLDQFVDACLVGGHLCGFRFFRIVCRRCGCEQRSSRLFCQ